MAHHHTPPPSCRRHRRANGRFALVSLALSFAVFGCKESEPSEIPETLEPRPGQAMPTVEPTPTPTPEISDLGITRAIERQLLFDHLTPSFGIDVETQDGIVELTGTVDNLLAQARATRIAESVRGVRSVSNRIMIETKPIGDAELATNVNDALLYDPATESYEIAVAASDGKITLTGTVDSWAEKQLAEQVAASVRGVEAVDNQVQVTYAAERTDSEILQEIEQLLARDVLIDDSQIEVSVNDGVVALTGKVGSAAERSRAHTRAWTAGVTAVDVEELEIDWFMSDPDLAERPSLRTAEQIEDAIKDAAMHDPRVLSFEIRPSVSGSTVTLYGSVDNLEAKRAAEQIARNSVGVARVINQIEVQPKAKVADKDIATAVRSQLLTNVHTDLYQIDVNVENGAVTLTGTVDSYFEKAEAADIASRARGVLSVDNLLQVEHPEIGYYFDPYLSPYHPYVEYGHTYAPPATEKSDQDIGLAIEDELFWSPFVDEDEVSVSVKNGVATLTGTVDSWREREAATQSAYEGGALYVDNLLHVEI